MNTTTDALMSVADVADCISMSERYAKWLINSGKLPSVRAVNVSAFKAWLQSLRYDSAGGPRKDGVSPKRRRKAKRA